MKKHAYLIMDNGKNPQQLNLLLSLLDYQYNDIFLHIDKKCKVYPHLNPLKKSNLFQLPQMKTYWGGFSLVECELRMLKFARKINTYEYYHLLSGQDIPLQSQDTIHKFFELNKGKEFINFDEKKLKEDPLIHERVSHYHFFSDVSFRRYNNKMLIIYAKALRKLEMLIQRTLKINRIKNDVLKYGSQWFSIDDEAAKYIIENKKIIEKKYKNTILCDELFLQTLIYKNKYFRSKLYKNNSGNLRYIDWNLGSPFVWDIEHFNLLQKASQEGYLFSRKFDMNKDKDVINKVIEKLVNKYEDEDFNNKK